MFVVGCWYIPFTAAVSLILNLNLILYPVEASWWQVDLQSQISLQKVIIYNRGDCCRDRLSNTTVFLFDENDYVVGTFRIVDASNMDEIEIDIANFIPPNFQSFINQQNNNLCIDVLNGQVNEGQVQLWTCNGTDAQKWYMDPLGRIRSKVDTNKCIVARKPDDQLAKLWVTTCNDYAWQSFVVESNGSIRNEYYNQYVGAELGCGGVSEGLRLELQDKFDGDGTCTTQQRWIREYD